MKSWLDELYPSGGSTSVADPQNDQQKQAEASAILEKFASLCAESGIDLAAYTPEQRAWLFDQTMGKEAAEGESAEEEEDEDEEEMAEEVVEEAKKEYEEKKAAVKLAEDADLFGRICAHRFVDELNAIEKRAQEGGSQVDVSDRLKQAAAELAAPVQTQKLAAPTYFDAVALKRAVKLASAAGYDVQQVAERLAAQATLGLPESVKVASGTFEEGVDFRALELLEHVGCTVNWDNLG